MFFFCKTIMPNKAYQYICFTLKHFIKICLQVYFFFYRAIDFNKSLHIHLNTLKNKNEKSCVKQEPWKRANDYFLQLIRIDVIFKAFIYENFRWGSQLSKDAVITQQGIIVEANTSILFAKYLFAVKVGRQSSDCSMCNLT